MAPILRPWVAELDEVGQRGDMVPSSFMISQITERARARRAGEVAAGLGVAGADQHAARLGHDREDVPGLDDVVRAGRGGRPRPGRCARGRAPEMPVVTPVAASIDTVKAVRELAAVVARHLLRPSWRQRSSVRVRQIRPRAGLAT